MNVNEKNEKSIEAMHQLKEQARMMKEALLKGRLNEFGEILDFGFQQKRNGFLTVGNARQGNRDSRLGETVAQQQDVIFAVVSDKYSI